MIFNKLFLQGLCCSDAGGGTSPGFLEFFVFIDPQGKHQGSQKNCQKQGRQHRPLDPTRSIHKPGQKDLPLAVLFPGLPPCPHTGTRVSKYWRQSFSGKDPEAIDSMSFAKVKIDERDYFKGDELNGKILRSLRMKKPNNVIVAGDFQ